MTPVLEAVLETVLGGVAVFIALGIASYVTHVVVARRRLVELVRRLGQHHQPRLQKRPPNSPGVLQSVLVECPDGGYFIGAKQNLGYP